MPRHFHIDQALAVCMAEVSQTKGCSSSLTLLVAFFGPHMVRHHCQQTHVPLCHCSCLHCAGCHFSHHILTPPGHNPGTPAVPSPGTWISTRRTPMRVSRLAALWADAHYGHLKEHEVLELSTAAGQPQAWAPRSTPPESPSLSGLTKAKHRCHHAKTVESCFAALWMPKEIQEPNPLYFHLW